MNTNQAVDANGNPATTYRISSDQGRTVEEFTNGQVAVEYIKSLISKGVSYSVEYY